MQSRTLPLSGRAGRSKHARNQEDLQGRSTPDDVRELIEILSERWGPTKIERFISRHPGSKGKAPKLRTVSTIIDKYRKRKKKETWVSKGATSRDERAVMDALAAVTAWTRGQIRCVTKGEAERIIQIRAVAPKMGALTAWRLARSYVRRESDDRSWEDLDSFVAFYGFPDEDTSAHADDLLNVMKLAGLLPVYARVQDREYQKAKWDLFCHVWGEQLYEQFMATATWSLQETWEQEHSETASVQKTDSKTTKEKNSERA
jgi:hypothetical protein